MKKQFLFAALQLTHGGESEASQTAGENQETSGSQAAKDEANQAQGGEESEDLGDRPVTAGQAQNSADKGEGVE